VVRQLAGQNNAGIDGVHIAPLKVVAVADAQNGVLHPVYLCPAGEQQFPNIQYTADQLGLVHKRLLVWHFLYPYITTAGKNCHVILKKYLIVC